MQFGGDYCIVSNDFRISICHLQNVELVHEFLSGVFFFLDLLLIPGAFPLEGAFDVFDLAFIASGPFFRLCELRRVIGLFFQGQRVPVECIVTAGAGAVSVFFCFDPAGHLLSHYWLDVDMVYISWHTAAQKRPIANVCHLRLPRVEAEGVRAYCHALGCWVLARRANLRTRVALPVELNALIQLGKKLLYFNFGRILWAPLYF